MYSSRYGTSLQLKFLLISVNCAYGRVQILPAWAILLCNARPIIGGCRGVSSEDRPYIIHPTDPLSTPTEIYLLSDILEINNMFFNPNCNLILEFSIFLYFFLILDFRSLFLINVILIEVIVTWCSLADIQCGCIEESSYPLAMPFDRHPSHLSDQILSYFYIARPFCWKFFNVLNLRKWKWDLLLNIVTLLW